MVTGYTVDTASCRLLITFTIMAAREKEDKLDKCIHQVREVLFVHFLHVRGDHVVGGPG